MDCPECGSFQTQIVDSRRKGKLVKRRRWCLDCGHRFSTVEISKEQYDKLLEQSELLMRLRSLL